VVRATGATPWEAADLLADALGWEAALPPFLAGLAANPLGAVLSLAALASRATEGPDPDPGPFLDRLRGVGLHPLSVALAAAVRDGGGNRRIRGGQALAAQASLELADRLGVDPRLAATIFAFTRIPRTANPSAAQRCGRQGEWPDWPADLRIVPLDLRIRSAGPLCERAFALPDDLTVNGSLAFQNLHLAPLPLGLKVRGHLEVDPHTLWDGEFPDGLQVQRLFIGNLFPGCFVPPPRPNPEVVSSGVSPSGWRRFRSLEAGFIKNGIEPPEAATLAKRAILDGEDPEQAMPAGGP
jgi:hypothetical protein